MFSAELLTYYKMTTLQNTTELLEKEFFLSLRKNKEILEILYEDWKQYNPVKECPICYKECGIKDQITCPNGLHLACCSECFSKVSTNKCPMCRFIIEPQNTEATTPTAPVVPTPLPVSLQYENRQNTYLLPSWQPYYNHHTRLLARQPTDTEIGRFWNSFTLYNHSQKQLGTPTNRRRNIHHPTNGIIFRDENVFKYYLCIKATPNKRFHYCLELTDFQETEEYLQTPYNTHQTEIADWDRHSLLNLPFQKTQADILQLDNLEVVGGNIVHIRKFSEDYLRHNLTLYLPHN